MATSEYNQEQSGLRSELEEPRRTTEHDMQNTGFDAPPQQQTTGGYGGVSEDEPPHHKIHTDDEPLPKPTSGPYDDEPREEQVMPSGTGSGYGDPAKPQSTEQYGDHRSEGQKGPVDETPETESRNFGGEKSAGYSEPSDAFAGAPVDRKYEEPGYGQDVKTSEPLSTTMEPESPTPKKEGFVQKLKDKLPGHKTGTPETMEDPSPTATGEPKKGFVTKIKEKLPGHHSTTQ